MTHDGGKTWANSRSHRIYPAPWYYLSLLLVLGLTWMGLRHRHPLHERISVADVLASDRPVDARQYDALNLDPLAQAVSRFLRNESTQPPLTMAVTGEWGSGKSSLMNLLRDDLLRHGFRPVSFNAWHHQKEEHLLASLLESIRRQAIPSLWTRGGIRYRLRLLWIRGSRAWFLAFLVVFGIALYTGLFLAAPSSLSTHLARAEQVLGKLIPWLTDGEPDAGPAPAAPGLPKTGQERTALITWLLGLGAVAEALRRGLRSFGMRPAQLLAFASGSSKLSALEQQLGFRSHFSREFSDVTRALHPRSMVILIDDLDRCRPENVSEILEAVNFLVSSGECVIVMGLDLDRVERAVGLAFRDVATEMLDLSSGSSPNRGQIVVPGEIRGPQGEEGAETTPSEEPTEAEELKLHRQRFARQYLEKLINIEVPVPRPSAEEFADLFELLHKDEEQQGFPAAFILKAAGALRRWSLALIALTVLGLGFWLGFSSGKKAVPPSPPVTTVQTETKPAPSPAPTPQAQAAPAQPEPAPAREQPFQDARFLDAQPGKRSFAWLMLPLALILPVAVWRVVQAREDIVKDSPEFIRALRIWTPFLFSRRNNPRAAKRFLNRVRYYAMFQRPYSPPMSLLERLLMRLGLLRRKKTFQPSVPIPEGVLVALSALQHCEREWLSDRFLYSNLGEYLAQKDVPRSLQDQLDEFRSWGSLEDYRESFARISTGIRVT